MANPYDVTRTNMFRVTDVDAFIELMQRADTGEDEVQLFLEDAPLVGFGFYDRLRGFELDEDDEELSDDNNDDDNDVDAFLSELGKLIEPGDACIVFCAYHEKLRCVGGYAYIVTNDTVDFLSLHDAVVHQARGLLGNSTWKADFDA